MGYYRSEYEDYYRGVRGISTGKSSYVRGEGYTNQNIVNSSRRTKREKKNGTVEMILTQIIGISLIGGIVYFTNVSKDTRLQEVYKNISGIIKTDYYFNEKEIALSLKGKVLEAIKEFKIEIEK
ncbi:hypothetical protein [uncultured Clostridium sp.]|uniref:hypothetical protein n=1 Tax=uncultured Clostridium sp. TaxID=59620 RepID=UPI00260EF4D3|nr:hypothetical protein [uncultured Clostridium sp.]